MLAFFFRYSIEDSGVGRLVVIAPDEDKAKEIVQNTLDQGFPGKTWQFNVIGFIECLTPGVIFENPQKAKFD